MKFQLSEFYAALKIMLDNNSNDMENSSWICIYQHHLNYMCIYII